MELFLKKRWFKYMVIFSVLKKVILVVFLVFFFGAKTEGVQGRQWHSNPFYKGDSVATDVAQGNMNSTLDNALTLNGIWRIGDIYKAMISGEVVVIGSMVNGYIVTGMGQKIVVVRAIKSGEVIKLEMVE
jgi:hypothetical protein